MHKRRSRGQRGGGIVEYILITAMVALAAVAIFRRFRDDVSTAYLKAGEALIEGVDQSLAAEPSNG